jgi:formate dehydrogenase subunit gamma
MTQEAEISAIIDAHKGLEGPMLPILNDIQAAFGHVSEDAIRQIAQALNITRAEVHGVVSFYHDYRKTPAKLPVIKVCMAEACQARGVERLAKNAESAAQNRAEIETVYCLGLCSAGPAALVGEEVYARLDDDKMAALIAKVAS